VNQEESEQDDIILVRLYCSWSRTIPKLVPKLQFVDEISNETETSC